MDQSVASPQVREMALVRTDRLRLAPVTLSDAEELFVIMSDPAGWWYQPARRHTELQTTIAFCEWVAAMWLSDSDGEIRRAYSDRRLG